MSDAQRKALINNEKSPAPSGGDAPNHAPNQSGLRSSSSPTPASPSPSPASPSPSLDGAASTVPGETLQAMRESTASSPRPRTSKPISDAPREGSGLHRITAAPSAGGSDSTLRPGDTPPESRRERTSTTLPNSDSAGGQQTSQARKTSGHASTIPASGDDEHSRWDISQFPVIDAESYSIGGELARGGIGRVLRARDSRLKRPVAIKELLETHGSASERFVREALLTARLQHPSIIPVYEAGLFPTGEPFFAMKLVSGKSFDEVIAKAKTLEERMALLPHVLNVCDAMAYAHSERIIHRDLKPQNILVGAFGETVVVDWGLAKDLSEEPVPPNKGEKSSAASPRHLTLAGSVMGTPAYMPPEQAAGRPVDERADVYSLGAILYHVLSGVAPYDGPTSVQILAQVASGPPVELREIENGIPDDLLTIVDKALERDPNDRYPSAKELADDLRRFQTGQIVSAHRYSTRQRIARFVRRRRAPLLVAAVAFAVLSVAGTLSVRNILEASKKAAAKQAEAEIAEQKAAQRADDLTIVQARASLERDPTKSIEWLASLSPAFPDMQRVRFIAADARQRGIARILKGHLGQVNAVAFSPSPKKALLASVSDDHTLRVWNIQNRETRTLSGHFDEIWRVAFSSDGTFIATGGKDKTARVWSAETGAVLAIAEYGAEVSELTFSPDGRSLAAFDRIGGGRLFNVDTGTPRELVGAKARIHDLLFSPGGERVFAAFGGTSINVWESSTGKEQRRLNFPEPFYRIAISRDCKRAALVTNSHTLFLWDLETDEKQAIQQNIPGVERLRFSPNGRTFVTTDISDTVMLWNAATGTATELSNHRPPITAAAFSPDSNFIAIAGSDRSLHVWNISTLERRILSGFEDSISDIAFSSDGSHLAAASPDRTVRLFSLSDGTPQIIARHAKGLPHLVTSPDGQWLLTAQTNGKAHLIHLNGNNSIELIGLAGPIKEAVFSPENDRLVTAGPDGTAQVWDLTGYSTWTFQSPDRTAIQRLVYAPDGHRIFSLSSGGLLMRLDADSGQSTELAAVKNFSNSIVLSPDGKYLVTGHSDGTIRAIDTDSGKHRDFVGHDGKISALAFTPGGHFLVSGGADHTVRMWDMNSNQTKIFRIGGTEIEDIDVSPDGELLAVLSGDNSIHLLQPATNRELDALRGHEAKVTRTRFSSDGRFLLSASQDKTARLWHLDLKEGRPFLGHSQAVTDILFGVDDNTILTLSQDGAVRLFKDDLPEDPKALRAWLRGIIQ